MLKPPEKLTFDILTRPIIIFFSIRYTERIKNIPSNFIYAKRFRDSDYENYL